MIQFKFLRTMLFAAFMFAAIQSPTFAAGLTEPLELVNETGKTIMSLYFVPVQKNGWGNDLVGSGVMNQGDRRSINYDSAFATYKIKVEFADGKTITVKSVDLLNVWRLAIMSDGTFSRNARG
jgi:hypothetical protein